jgi:hypothetical protein
MEQPSGEARKERICSSYTKTNKSGQQQAAWPRRRGTHSRFLEKVAEWQKRQ